MKAISRPIGPIIIVGVSRNIGSRLSWWMLPDVQTPRGRMLRSLAQLLVLTL